MQSMPLLLRQSLRSTVNLTRGPSHPVRTPLLSAVGPKALPVGNRWRDFSVCLQCQFRTQSAVYVANENEKSKDERPAEQVKDADLAAAVLEASTKAEIDAGSQGSPPSAAESAKEPGNEQRKDGNNIDTTEGGGLPSYLENRRSQYAKQFSTMMDNLQSNVFVAGQRLNDLTGYSSIEALKKEIQNQEQRLRKARLQVRETKDAYAAAINRRSTSQREVNELLQRKHAWSPADLERFTHLYRNDHTNEVAENEAQEGLSAAERESEEAAAQLSRSILSRYHEEQVWSDKIRQMSTWGTWGLMGVNVLLFLIFQIAVEPWRRKRLVKGFEEKVIEAIEKEKNLNHVEILSAAHGEQQTPATPTTTSTTQETAESSAPLAEASSTTDATVSSAAIAEPADVDGNTTPTTAPTDETTTNDATTNPVNNLQSQISRISSPSIDSWRQSLRDLFSDRSIVLTQRDLSTVAIQSAAAGAAVMGLVIALIRPR